MRGIEYHRESRNKRERGRDISTSILKDLRGKKAGDGASDEIPPSIVPQIYSYSRTSGLCSYEPLLQSGENGHFAFGSSSTLEIRNVSFRGGGLHESMNQSHRAMS